MATARTTWPTRCRVKVCGTAADPCWRLCIPRCERLATISPLRDLLPDHIAPERLFLEARWASLVPYAVAGKLLADVLPVASGANATTLGQHVLQVAERAERDLGRSGLVFSMAARPGPSRSRRHRRRRARRC